MKRKIKNLRPSHPIETLGIRNSQIFCFSKGSTRFDIEIKTDCDGIKLG